MGHYRLLLHEWLLTRVKSCDRNAGVSRTPLLPRLLVMLWVAKTKIPVTFETGFNIR